MYIRKNSYLENFLNKIKDNTDNNNHSDNVMLITRSFKKGFFIFYRFNC